MVSTVISSVITNSVTQKPVPLLQERFTLECSPFIDDHQQLAKDSADLSLKTNLKRPSFVQRTLHPHRIPSLQNNGSEVLQRLPLAYSKMDKRTVHRFLEGKYNKILAMMHQVNTIEYCRFP
jgi:hypothetical protein